MIKKLLTLIAVVILLVSVPVFGDLTVPFSDDFNRADSSIVGSFWEELPDYAELQNGTAYLYGGKYDRPQISTPQFAIDQSGIYILEFKMKLQANDTENKEGYYMFYFRDDRGLALFHVYANDGHLGLSTDDNYWWWNLHDSQWSSTEYPVARNQWGNFRFIIDFGAKTFSGWRNDDLIWNDLQFINNPTEFVRLNFSTGETTGTAQMWVDNVSFAKAPEFDASSDLITNPWLGLFYVGDSYSLAGYGIFADATRSYSLIGNETVLAVDCVVLRIEGHGENPAIEYYDAKIAQDTAGNLRVLKITGVDDGGGAFSWQAASADVAPIFIPANPQVGQIYSFVDGDYHEVIAMDQTVGQMSPGAGPYQGCMQYDWNDGDGDTDQQYHCPGIGIVKEVWDDDGTSNGWERIPSSNSISNPMTWVYIDDDPGVTGHEGFSGFMSKYETTNAQYCEYLNAAKASGDVTISGSYVVGSSGPYSGQNYYYLAGGGYTYNEATNGGAARINYSGGTFTVDSGFENHPVTYVSWYGSTAFASYYNWRLPTEWEWQAVADYDGTYTYAHGPGTINNSLANYLNSTHPYGTTAVGAYGSIHGYGMCDMAGNVWEWTSTVHSSSRIDRGGGWYFGDDGCTVSFWSYVSPSYVGNLGFRVCLTVPVDKYWYGWIGANHTNPSHPAACDSGDGYLTETIMALDYISEDGNSEKESLSVLSEWYDQQGWLNKHLWADGGSDVLQFLSGNNMLAYIHREPDSDNDLGTTLLVKKAIGATDSDIAGEYGYFGHWQEVSTPATACAEFGTLQLNSNYSFNFSADGSDGESASGVGTWLFDSSSAVVTMNFDGGGSDELQAGQGGILMKFDIDPIEDDDLGYSYLVKKGSGKTMQSIAGRYLYQEFSTDAGDNEPFTGWGVLEFETNGTWNISCTYNDGSTNNDSGTYTIENEGDIHITNMLSHVYDGTLSYNDQSITVALMGQTGDVGVGIAQRSSDCNGNGILDVFEIKGDTNGDGIVDFLDFAKFAEYWLEDNCGMCGCADIACDGKVDIDDLMVLCDNWLEGSE